MSYGYNFNYYEPNDDSYIFVDFLAELEIKNKIIVDLGCSTCVLTDVVNKNNLVISTDINKLALKQVINEDYNLICTDLLKGIRISYIDIIIFNAPYVPDEEESEYKDKSLGGAILEGGEDGCDVIDQFIKFINENECKMIYLLCIKANENKQRIADRIDEKYTVRLVREKKIVGETIRIYEIINKYRN